jgi:hypothetical protein
VTGENYGVYYKTNKDRGDKDKNRTPVGVEQVKVDTPQVKGEKFIKDGQLYIRCGENVYDVTGTPLQLPSLR